MEAGSRGVLSHTGAYTFFIVEGIFHIVASLTHRNVMLGSWSWMLVSGVADLPLAAIIIAGWPLSTGLVLGLLVGVNLITCGLALVMAAITARNVVEPIGSRC
jgi:uncharacterized membrane protein HdeD (DUF308 family)